MYKSIRSTREVKRLGRRYEERSTKSQASKDHTQEYKALSHSDLESPKLCDIQTLRDL
jgi:hypothetical protein